MLGSQCFGPGALKRRGRLGDFGGGRRDAGWIRERDARVECLGHVVEEDFHRSDVGYTAGGRVGEDVAADLIGGVVNYPGAGVASFCWVICQLLCQMAQMLGCEVR